MRNLFVFAVLGLAGLGWFAEQASAGPIRDCLCCKKCCLKLCAKQYNAFSPYCLDSLSGCLPLVVQMPTLVSVPLSPLRA